MKRHLVSLLFIIMVHISLTAGGVVSLLPSITDMVVELGAADRLTGVTRYCIIPDRTGLTRLGGMYDLNVEALLKLNPDLILAYRGGERTLAPLTEAGIRVRFFSINTLADVFSTYQDVGSELGVEEKAQIQLDRVRGLLHPLLLERVPRVLVILGSEGLERGPVYVAGRSIYGEIVTRLGGINPVAGPAAYPSLGREGLLTLKPDLVLLLTEYKVSEPAKTGMLSLLQPPHKPSIINIYGETAMHPGPSLFQLVPMIRNLMEAYASDPKADLSGHLVIR